MPVFQCPRCGNQRSRGRHQLCNVCWLIDDLIEEHQLGKHDKVNPSCPECKPRHDDEIARVGTDYIRRYTAPPLTPKLAKFLLHLDRHGFAGVDRYGEPGHRALIKLRDRGHLSITFPDGIPVLRISAHSRSKALELCAEGNSRTTRVQSPRDAFSTPKRQPATSHVSCTHESTPKARAKCRAERQALARD